MNKMKIAIYGDSYASFCLDQPNNHRGQSWVDVIKEYHDVENFGRPGSSFFYSYEKYLENFNKFDYNIFIIANPNRFYNRNLESLTSFTSSWYTNYNNVILNEEIAKKGNHLKELKIIESVRDYYENWRDDETDSKMTIFLIEKLKEHRKNTLYIDAFSQKFNPYYSVDVGLIDISIWEQNQVGFLEKYDKNNIQWGYIKNGSFLSDNRLNHLSEENNLILGNQILKSIKDNQHYLKLKLEDFVKPKHDIDFYVTWIPL